ncbi:MAG: sulfotransferase domain-containing protein, partial [Acidobacteriota bacterium]|nr:sulfotransferase domain-containing protein [Acidobacteriota bacterium]
MVRDPVERMISHWVHTVCNGTEHRPVEEALTAPAPNRYLNRSKYWTQLERYLAHFPPHRILVVKTERLLHERRTVLGEIFGYLGVDADFDSWRFAVRRHRSSLKRRKTRMGRRISESAPLRTLRRVPLYLRWPVEEALFLPLSRRIRRPALAP